MIAINKTKPTTRTYVLYLFFLCLSFTAFGQEVNEDFDGYIIGPAPSSHSYNNFNMVSSRSTNIGRGATESNAVHLFTGPASMEYVGADGNGKDGGIGVISFWYRMPNVSASRFASFSIIASVDGVDLTPALGSISHGLGGGSTTYTQRSFLLNNPSDNIKIRIVKNGSSNNNQLFIDDFQITNFALTATWTGSTWDWSDDAFDGTVPTLALKPEVIINGNLDTSIGGLQTSFGGKHLTVNSGFTLTIADNTYVEIDRNVTVDGTVVVKSKGAFVQVDDSGTVGGAVLSDRTKIRVEKVTSALVSPNEYTYWSSPVIGETIATGLFEANPNRVYSFNGQNYLDATKETSNNNAIAPGQDDIDDNYNDWQFASSGTIMQPGVGYAAMHKDNGLFPLPLGIEYIFEGPLNNGEVLVPIYRNDAELADNNWNFIGNPYPSAIDADAFLAANASIGNDIVNATTGAIFLWSHSTPLNASANGNDIENYAQSDYAIINGSGTTAGGDGIFPTRFIPSGQGFFVSMDNAAPSTPVSGTIETTNVVFNNSMRVTGDNNLFFRSTVNNEANKLWLDLSSDNGVFNQILVAYVAGATDAYDGMYYDADKNLSSGTFSSIYSTIEDLDNKKFAIQGKNPNSLSLDEVIPVGFSTSITEPTLYKLSLSKLEGEFMLENTVYLRDHLLNITHNLSSIDYTFTSEVGDFSSRFEIVFRAEALSIDEASLNENALTITELSNGEVAFSVGRDFNLSNVTIFDLLGREIYNLPASQSREVYNLSQLGKAAYIAKVTLSNGQVISKKAIKQR